MEGLEGPRRRSWQGAGVEGGIFDSLGQVITCKLGNEATS
jgi:hypothetical protein